MGSWTTPAGRTPAEEPLDELLKWRDEFPILGRTTYMISNSLGAMPRGVYDKVREYAESWATRGVRAWRSEEHTSELQSQSNLVCRLLLEKKKKDKGAAQHCKI